MIISRTPLRMSFVGGGSDMPEFYRRHGGAVISTAIDKYVYVTTNKKFDNGTRVAYSKTEEVGHASEIEHKLVRAAMNELELEGGIEITTVADIPSKGTGLGSSSSFTVALLHGLSAYKGIHCTAEMLASKSCEIEIDICREPIGKQDQYAAAYGGFNVYEFLGDDQVRVDPVVCRKETLNEIQSSILMMYTGITRSASSLLKTQGQEVSSSRKKQNVLRKMVQLVYDLRDEIQANRADSFASILHENWMLKKSLTAGISTGRIDEWYDRAMAAGARGGKLLGAGAGGFMIFVAPPERHAAICHALPELRPIPFAFERFGSQIIFYNPTGS